MAEPGIKEGLKLLAQADFRRLFFAYLITFTGSAMAPIALAFGVLELTGSTRDSAIVIAAPTTAQILVLLVGGALADRFSRQKIMVRAEVLAATSQGCIAALFLMGFANVPVLAGLMLVNGIAVAFFMPATMGFITQVVDRKDLQAANALLGAARSSAFLAGAALAGILVASVGAGLTILIDAISFVFSAILIVGIRPRPQEAVEPASLLEDLKLGWREFISHQWLWTIVLQFSIMVASFEAVFGLLGPAMAKEYMNGPTDWGLIAAASGLGTVLGGLIALRINPRRPMLFATFCCFFFAGTAAALYLMLPMPLVAIGAFIGGISGQMFAVLWYTTLQTVIPSNMLSRVSAYDHLGSIALAPLGVVAGGYLFEVLGPEPTMLIAMLAIVVPTAAVLFVPDIWRLQLETWKASDSEAGKTDSPTGQ